MTRGTMRRILRRRLREVNPNPPNEVAATLQWQDSDLNEVLSAALQFIQAEIQEVCPNAFIERDTIDVVGPVNSQPAQQFYPLPYGFSGESLVEWLDPTTGAYTSIERGDFWFLNTPLFLEASESVDFNTSTPPPGIPNPVTAQAIEYARIGKYLFISPAPSVSQAAGIRLTFNPALDMADDNDTPELHPALHFEVVLQAHLMLVGETSDSADGITQVLAIFKAKHPTLYANNGGEPFTMLPQLNKGY